MDGRSDKGLWQRITAHDLDKVDSEFTFTQRLARDNGWSQSFAARVVKEYKKFIYLICVSGRTLTPSDEVDQAWHLHLTYTRDYWGTLCKDVTKKEIHHGPTKGGVREDSKFRECYKSTKSVYQHEFAAPPPADIWPDEKVRFGNAAHLKRLDTSAYYVIPRHPFKFAFILSGFALLSGCKFLGMEISDRNLIIGSVIVLGLIIVWMMADSNGDFDKGRRKKRRRKDGSGCSGCSGCGSSMFGSDSDGNGGGGDSGCSSSGCGGGGCGGD